jgi:His-Xaa-Ser system protein HxsD
VSALELTVDVEGRSVSFTVPKALYSMDALRIAAHILDRKAEVGAQASGKAYEIELTAKSKKAGRSELETLAGEFLNELLNQEYRFLVSRFNEKLSNLIVTQALFAARGGEHPPTPSAAEQAPEFKAQVAAMLARAEDEIERTMPKRVSSAKPLSEAV